MKIVLIGRAEGGMKTHLECLHAELSKKHEVRLLTQNDFTNIKIYSGIYYINILGVEKLRQAIAWADVVHCHQPSFSFDFVIPYLKSKTPIVNTFHCSIGDRQQIFRFKALLLDSMDREMLVILGRLYSKRSSRYIAVGTMQKEILEKYNTTCVINNGISVNNFKKKKVPRYFKEFTVGYLGRVDPEKNVISLIEACQELGVNLVIAGMSTEYEDYRRRYEGPRVKFVGPKAYPPVEFYNAIDVFCSPSFIEANISLTVLEAMACETPVIASGCGGEEKYIERSFGLITKPDKESIKAAILKIKTMNLRSMGKAARAFAKKHYDIRDMVAKVEVVYNDVLNKKQRKK